jgi:osmotically-inducible protein OsmY
MKLYLPIIFTVMTFVTFSFGAQAVTPASSPTQRDKADAQINTGVMNKLYSDRFFSPAQIDVMTNEGIVTLDGKVRDWRSKQRAVSIAENIQGVRSVIDRLVIAGVNETDPEIAQNVQEALHLDGATAGLPVNVMAKSGVVTLSGNVKSWGEKALAEWVAGGVAGVRGVQNNIVVRFKGPTTDAEISKEVHDFLSQDPWLYSRSISVYVQNGKVQLSGKVGSLAEKRRASLAAWGTNASGVDTSKLQIDPNLFTQNEKPRVLKNMTDGQIAKDVRSALFYDPRVSSLDVKVEVHNKVVSLSGIVDNLEAKRAAIQDAQNTQGVFTVASHVDVAQSTGTTDKRIVNDVKRLLELDPALNDFKIVIGSRGGVVSLQGGVNTGYERWLAENTASRVRGVVDVKNTLQVSSNLIGEGDNPERNEALFPKEQLYPRVIYEHEFPTEAYTVFPPSVDPAQEFTAAKRAATAGATTNEPARVPGVRVSQRGRAHSRGRIR